MCLRMYAASRVYLHVRVYVYTHLESTHLESTQLESTHLESTDLESTHLKSSHLESTQTESRIYLDVRSIYT